MPDAAYYRAWRTAHPAYRQRELERLRARKKSLTSAQRREQRGPGRRVIALEPIPPLHSGCDLFDRAKGMTRISHGYRFFAHPYYDDLVSEIVLALLEKRSTAQARRTFLDAEYAWRSKAIQVRDGYEARDGRLVIQDLEDY